MTINRGTIGALTSPGIRKAMFDSYMKQPEYLLPLFNVVSSKRAYEDQVEISGVGPSEEKAEGAPIIYKDIVQLTPKRILMITFALGMRCTMEAKQDELYGVLNRLAQVLGKSFAVRREVERAQVFNGGFITANRTGQDGLALFSTAHPLSGGQGFVPTATDFTVLPARTSTTTSNRLATAADLDYPSLIDMITLLMRQQDEQGDYITFTPRVLLTSVENWGVVAELLKSASRPDTANRADSAINGMAIQGVYSPYLLDTDAWFLGADKSDTDLTWYDRMPFTTDDEDEFGTGDTLIKGVERWGYGFASFRGWVGTPGA